MPAADLVPAGETPASHLRSLTHAGMARRWPGGVPAKVQAQVEHEIELIAKLRYEPYFLTVEDIVRYARTQGILCQGRGSSPSPIPPRRCARCSAGPSACMPPPSSCRTLGAMGSRCGRSMSVSVTGTAP